MKITDKIIIAVNVVDSTYHFSSSVFWCLRCLAILILRTYAISDNNRRLLFGLILCMTGSVIAELVSIVKMLKSFTCEFFTRSIHPVVIRFPRSFSAPFYYPKLLSLMVNLSCSESESADVFWLLHIEEYSQCMGGVFEFDGLRN